MIRVPLIAAVALLAVSCLLTSFVPPADDEFYYWCWSETLQWSYYDHPPMSALMIWASTAIFGDTLFALRLPACVSTAFVFGAILYLTQPRTLAWWLLATPLFTLGSVIVTPDTPLLMFWAAYMVWLVEVHKRLDSQQSISFATWVLGGLLLGGGVLGKYTMGLAVPTGFAAFLLAGQWKRWISGYIFHGVVSFLVAQPILIFNFQQDFAPLKYQWEHSMGTVDPSAKRFFEFVGIQILLFGTLPFFLFPWVVYKAKQLATDPRLRVCLCLFALPFAFFMYKASRGPLEGNWALVSYLAFWPLAAAWYEQVRASRGWRIMAPLWFLLPGLVVLIVTVHLIHPLSLLTPVNDRITRQTAKYELAREMAACIKGLPEKLPVYTDTYQWVSIMRFLGVDTRQVDGATRPSHFTQVPETLYGVENAYLLWNGPPPLDFMPATARVEAIATYPLRVRGKLITHFVIWRYTRSGKPAGVAWHQPERED